MELIHDVRRLAAVGLARSVYIASKVFLVPNTASEERSSGHHIVCPLPSLNFLTDLSHSESRTTLFSARRMICLRNIVIKSQSPT